MDKPIAHDAQRLTVTTVVATTGGIVFSALTLFGVGYLHRLGWCDGWSCTADVMQHALVCAVVAAIVAGALLLVRRKPYSRVKDGTPAAVALVYATLMVLLHPSILDLRAAISGTLFPYVTSIRFGWQGFVLVWSVSCVVIFSLVAAGAMATTSLIRSRPRS